MESSWHDVPNEEILDISAMEYFTINNLTFIVSFFSLFLNSTLIFVFIRHQEVRKRANMYIFSLALADLLAVIISTVMKLQQYINHEWAWGRLFCKFFMSSSMTVYGVSMFTIVALSIERYYITAKPLKSIQRDVSPLLSIGIVWSLAMILSLHLAVMSDVEKIFIKEQNDTLHTCVEISREFFIDYGQVISAFKTHEIIKQIVYFVIPSLSLGISYGLMALQLYKSARQMPGELSPQQKLAQSRSRQRLGRLVVTFIIIFFVCHMPISIAVICRTYYLFAPFWPNSVVPLLQTISQAHYCVDPIALYLLGGAYRKYFNVYLFCNKTAIQK